ncbi:MAG TPA: SGNH/GDSL hydrolase family protein [Clostridia bacterium]|nr:SGNH/GDSL hydrolase family protein [Clostridia bacterium]
MSIDNICIFGDSIGKGVVLNPDTKRYSVMKVDWESLLGGIGININNYARFGCTVSKALSVIKRYTHELMGYSRVLLEMGGNDCDFIWKDVAENPDKEHSPRTPPKEFRRLYGQIIDEIQASGGKPTVLNLPPLDPKRYFNWISRGLNADNILKWLGDVDMIYRWQEMYNVEVMLLATRMGVPIIDIRSAFLKYNNYRDFLCYDGIHPNKKGYELIYRTIAEQILP